MMKTLYIDKMLHDVTPAARLFIFTAVSVMLVCFIFSPSINLLYYAGDDFRYLFGGLDKSCKLNDGYSFVITLGRPLQAYIDCIGYKVGNTLTGMKSVRLLSVMLLGVGTGLLADYLFTLGVSSLSAFFVAGGLFLMKQLYGDTVAVGAICLPLTIVLVAVAYRCLAKFHELSSLPSGKLSQKMMWLLAAAVLIMMAILTYPALAFFFCILALMKILFSSLAAWTKTRKEIVIEIGLFLIVCVIYFICAYYNMRFHGKAMVPDSYRLDHPNINPAELLHRLSLIFNLFSPLWAFFPFQLTDYPADRDQGRHLVWLLSLGVVSALFCYLSSYYYKSSPKTAISVLLQATISAITVFILCSAFFLIMPNLEIIEQRLLYLTTASIYLVAVWSIWRVAATVTLLKHQILVLFTFVFFMVVSVQANIFMMANSLMYAQYMNIVKNQVKQYATENSMPKRIHFVLSKEVYPYDTFFLSSGVVSALDEGVDLKRKMKWCSLGREISGSEQKHQKEMLACLNKLKPEQIAVTYSYDDETYRKTHKMLSVEIKTLMKPKILHVYLNQFFGLS